MRILGAAVLALALAACSSPSPDAPEPSRPEPIATQPADPTPEADRCGASQAQSFVGKLRTEVPIPVDPEKQRVACTTCPVTMDFREDRLNFFFDAATGVIKKVSCG